jgi:hypothetical protein
MLSVPVDADRPIEQRSRLVGECARILGCNEIAAVAGFFVCSRNLHPTS